MSTIAEIARRAGKLFIDKSPTILSTVGVVGAVTTAYLAGKASFQAAEMIRAKEEEDAEKGIILDDRERMKERVQLVWKLYIPTFTVGAATMVSIVGGHRISTKRAAGLAIASTMSAKAFEQYKDKVVERLGSNKEQKIRDEVLQDIVNETYDPAELDIYGSKEGELCIDKFSLHYFRSSAEKIYKAVNDFNYILNRQGYATLADFYDLLGLPMPSYSEQVGWDIEWGLLDVKIGGTTTPNMKPCLTLEFKSEPRPVGSRFR